MDSIFDCGGIQRKLPIYYDYLIIPELFQKAVLERNTNQINNIIKNNPALSVSIVSYYDITLKNAFFFKKNAKIGIPNKIKWKTTTHNNQIILNFNELINLYKYITTSPWMNTNMGFLINCINNYLVKLRYVMGLINRRIPVNNYYYLGVNVTNNIQMKYYIALFIPGYR
jgi:hypothetical protein